MREIKELREKVLEELRNIGKAVSKNDSIPSGVTEPLEKLSAAAANLSKVIMYEQSGYSQEGSHGSDWAHQGSEHWPRSERSSYESWSHGGSSYDGNYSGGEQYTRGVGKQQFALMLQEVGKNAPDRESERIVDECISKLQRM